jgi:hypothetical protein
MNNPWPLAVFGIAGFYFGLQTLRVLPILLRLLVALWSGTVKWPGPTNRYMRDLFPDFILNSVVVMAAFAFSIMSFVGFLKSLLAIRQPGCFWILIIISYIGALFSSMKVIGNMVQVNALLLRVGKR